MSFSPDGKQVLSGGGDGTSRLWDRASGKELCQIVCFHDGSSVVVDLEGRYDPSIGGEVAGLHWIFPDEPFRPLPLELFLRDYYEPRLFSRILEGKRIKPVRPLAEMNRVQPGVRILGLKTGTLPEMAEVSVEVSESRGQFQRLGKIAEERTGVYDLRLFRDGQLRRAAGLSRRMTTPGARPHLQGADGHLAGDQPHRAGA